MKKVIPVSRLSLSKDRPQDAPVPGLLGTMAGGAAVSDYPSFSSDGEVLGVDACFSGC